MWQSGKNAIFMMMMMKKKRNVIPVSHTESARTKYTYIVCVCVYE